MTNKLTIRSINFCKTMKNFPPRLQHHRPIRNKNKHNCRFLCRLSFWWEHEIEDKQITSKYQTVKDWNAAAGVGYGSRVAQTSNWSDIFIFLQMRDDLSSWRELPRWPGVSPPWLHVPWLKMMNDKCGQANKASITSLVFLYRDK